MSDFVSLHNHTQFSLMNSLIKPIDLFKRAKELNQSAIAVTDNHTLAAAWDSLKASKETGVKLLMGCEFNFVDDFSNDDVRLRHLILIAKNHTGYKNLLKAHKLANDHNLEKFKKLWPRIDWQILQECSEDLICTTACCSGILSQLLNTRQIDKAKEQAKKLKDIFRDNLALEIQPHAMKRVVNLYNDYSDQTFTNYQLIKIGEELNIKVVATSPAHYLKKEDAEAHDVMLSIGSGRPVKSNNRPKLNLPEFYMKSRDEVKAFFTRGFGEKKAEEFCDNSLYFAEMCENPEWIDPKFTNPSGKELPVFLVKDQEDYGKFLEWWKNKNDDIKAKKEDAAYLRYWCERGLRDKIPQEKWPEYQQRLEEEFDVLEYNNFSSYMLIVSDIIDFCRRSEIPFGLGRGSAGGCLVGYLTGLHQANPLKYDLPFARFLNKERIEFPDCDLDSTHYGQEKIREYLQNKYGFDNIAKITNYNTMTPKPYAKNISRAFEYGGDAKAAVAIGNVFSEAIPAEIKTVSDALEKAPLFNEYVKRYPELAKFKELGSLPTAKSSHAGGVICSLRPLTEIVPLRKDEDGNLVIEYEKERAAENGLIKIDVLGIETLETIKDTYNLIKLSNKQLPPEPFDYDTYDQKTYDLICRGDTLCVFQLGESSGTINLCKRIKPKCIEDIAIINALARPSARDFRNDFIDTRDGKKKFTLIHPSLERAFKNSYGFGLFEDVLLYVASDVAKWNLYQADSLRKLTKNKGKYPEKVKEAKEKFISDAVKNNNIPEKIAIKIWEECINNFQGYGFNCAHATFYALTGYLTAYLKAHYPLEFLTANLHTKVKSNAVNAKDKVLEIKNEIRKYKVKIVSPHLNNSDLSYTIADQNTLMTGLDALKFMGKKAIPEILSKRPFASIEDLLSRTEGRKVPSSSVLALIASGSVDEFIDKNKYSRKGMFYYAADLKKKIQLYLKRKGNLEGFNYPWPEDAKQEWTIPEKFAMEQFYLGEGLSGKITEIYPNFFNSTAINFEKLVKDFPDSGDSSDKKFVNCIQCKVNDMFEFRVKKEDSKLFGQTMCKINISDIYGNPCNLTVFPTKLDYLKKRLKELSGGKVKLTPGIVLWISGNFQWYENSPSVILEDVMKCMNPPQLPKDLKGKSVKMPTIRANKKNKTIKLDPEELMEEVEEEIIENGLNDPNEEEFDPFADIENNMEEENLDD